MDNLFETHEPHVANYFTFALYFSEKKSKQLCQFLGDYPFVVTDSNGLPTGASGVVAPQLNMGSLHVRGLSLVVSEEEEEANENKEDKVRRVVGEEDTAVDTEYSGVIEDAAGRLSSFVRRIACSRADGSIAHLSLRFVDNFGGTVDPALVDCLLQKASVDKDEGREYVIDAIQTFCEENNIRVADHFEPSMAIVASRTHIAERLAGGPYDGEASVSGKTAMEMLGFWGFLLPSTYYVESSYSHVHATTEPSSGTDTNQRESTTSERADPKRIIFEEPNPFYRPDVVIMKPEVASQRSYSHDLCVMRAEDLVRATDEGPNAVGRLIARAVEAPEGSNPRPEKEKEGDGIPPFSKETRWVVQECLSLLALPVVYKVYVAGDYLSVMCYDAREFTEGVARAVSDCCSSSSNDMDGAGGRIACGGNNKDAEEKDKEESCRPILLKNGAKGFFKALASLTERRAFQEESSLNAECINYFAKGTRNYDDLWQTVQFLKRPDHLGVQFFGLDVLVVKGISSEPDRRYIVDVNYLPSYKNETPARLFPALLKAMMEVHH